MSNKIHTLSGTSFHGAYRVTVRGPAEGFILSARQAKKIARAKCDYDGCMCGGEYGERDNGSAWTDYSVDGVTPWLRTAGYADAEEAKERKEWLAQMDREEEKGLASMAAQYGADD